MATLDRLATYLHHLHLDAPPERTPDGLARLQAAHRETIGFGNLDLRLGNPVRIDSEAVFDKLVMRRRGGYCFEHNQLYADMLSALGFEHRPLLARVRLGLAQHEIAPRTHVLSLVTLDGEDWVSDPGFGGSFVPPMRLEDGMIARTADGASHRLRRTGETGDLIGQWLVERAGPASAKDGRAAPHPDWQPQYGVDLAPVAQPDLDMGNHWTATHPGSRFLTVHVASIALPGGFASLLDRLLTVHRGNSVDKSALDTPEAYRGALCDMFGFDYSLAEVKALPLFGTAAP